MNCPSIWQREFELIDLAQEDTTALTLQQHCIQPASHTTVFSACKWLVFYQTSGIIVECTTCSLQFVIFMFI